MHKFIYYDSLIYIRYINYILKDEVKLFVRIVAKKAIEMMFAPNAAQFSKIDHV